MDPPLGTVERSPEGLRAIPLAELEGIARLRLASLGPIAFLVQQWVPWGIW